MGAPNHMLIHSEKHASPEELALALGTLGAADFVRLGLIARFRARGLPEVDWRDLLQESVERALTGARRWPIDVPLLVFLGQTMRSVASEAWRRRAQLSVSAYPIDDPDAPDSVSTLVDYAPDPERAAVAKDLVRHLHKIFAEDSLALTVIEGLAEGLDAREIQERTPMSATDYDSTRRRIRRRITQVMPELL